MVDLRSRLSRGLCERRRRMRALFRERDVVWIGTRCLTLGIRGIASAGCIFGTAVPDNSISYDSRNQGDRIWYRTFRSSHVVNLFTPSPTSLNPSLASSRRSCTLSLTLSVSRFVPRRFSCCDRRPIFDVRLKSCSERLSLKRLNSGSSRYSGSSLRRYVVGLFVCQHETREVSEWPYLAFQSW